MLGCLEQHQPQVWGPVTLLPRLDTRKRGHHKRIALLGRCEPHRVWPAHGLGYFQQLNFSKLATSCAPVVSGITGRGRIQDIGG